MHLVRSLEAVILAEGGSQTLTGFTCDYTTPAQSQDVRGNIACYKVIQIMNQTITLSNIILLFVDFFHLCFIVCCIVCIVLLFVNRHN